MKIVIIGATGFVGSHLLKEALKRDHDVTIIVRHPEKVIVQHPALTIKAGNVLSEHEVAVLVKGQDAVLSAYNAGWQNPNLYDEYLEGAQAIQAGVKRAGVKRLLVVGGAGSLEVAPGVQLVDTPQFPAAFKQGALAARDYFNLLRKEDQLEWTFLSPAILMGHHGTDGRTGTYRLGTDQPVFDNKGESRISVEDLCVALLDELENKRFVRKRFTVGY